MTDRGGLANASIRSLHATPRGPRAPARRGARGFSLLEVLVAFVILALVATALFRLFSGALDNASAPPTSTAARCWSPRACSPRPAAPGRCAKATRTGGVDDGRIDWTATRRAVRCAPGVSPELERASETLPMRLYRIVVEVAFPAPTGGQRTFALATMRIGPRESR